MRRLVLVLLLVVGTLLVAQAGPAHACSWVPPEDDAAAVELSDIAFVADVESVTTDGNEVTWGLDVAVVYRGEVADDQEVVTDLFDVCHVIRPQVGERWFIVSHDGRAVSTIGGTRPLAPGELADLTFPMAELVDRLW